MRSGSADRILGRLAAITLQPVESDFGVRYGPALDLAQSLLGEPPHVVAGSNHHLDFRTSRPEERPNGGLDEEGTASVAGDGAGIAGSSSTGMPGSIVIAGQGPVGGPSPAGTGHISGCESSGDAGGNADRGHQRAGDDAVDQTPHRGNGRPPNRPDGSRQPRREPDEIENGRPRQPVARAQSSQSQCGGQSGFEGSARVHDQLQPGTKARPDGARRSRRRRTPASRAMPAISSCR